MQRYFWFSGMLLLLTVAAFCIRWPRLEVRPVHADEAVQASRFRELWWGNGYRYDPHEYHGPTLNYLTLPAIWLTGSASFAETTASTFRAVPVVFGAALVVLLFLLRDGLGSTATLWAGCLLAVSPAMVFYNRYYIHESLLVFFTLVTIGCAWRYCVSRRLAWCLAAGAGVGLMQATKETTPLVLASMLAASMATLMWRRLFRDPVAAQPPRVSRRHLLWGTVTALVVAGIWFTSFLVHPSGVLDAVRTYLPWLGRAAGESPHVHPWYYYLQLLGFWRAGDGPWWSEAAILILAGAGWLVALFPPGARFAADGNVVFVRWLGFYTLFLAAAYSAIPYKTPWCLLGFLEGAILLAGFGAAAFVRVAPGWIGKAALGLGLCAAVAHLGWQAYRASYTLPADPRNPYVYAQTLPDIERLAADVAEIARATDRHTLTIKVFWHDGYYWPLPWYLREFHRVGYWTEVTADAGAPLLIASPLHDEALTRQLDETHLMTGYYAVRKNVFAQLWVRMDLWEAHLKRLGRI